MNIENVDLDKALTCAFLAKEVYLKFPAEVEKLPDLEEHKRFSTFSQFPNADVFLHHCDESDTQCAIAHEPGSDHVYLVFRGTEKNRDWATNVRFTRKLFQVRNKGKDVEEVAEPSENFELVVEEGAKHFELVSSEQESEEGNVAPQFPRARLHLGFVQAYMAIQDHVHNYLAEHSPKKITVTGHSLGGALATLCATDLKLTYLSKYDVELYTFGAPRVGNEEFPELFNFAVPNSYRFVNGLDVVPDLPLEQQGFRHVNHEVKLGQGLSWRFISRRGTDHFMKQYIKELEAVM